MYVRLSNVGSLLLLALIISPEYGVEQMNSLKVLPRSQPIQFTVVVLFQKWKKYEILFFNGIGFHSFFSYPLSRSMIQDVEDNSMVDHDISIIVLHWV